MPEPFDNEDVTKLEYEIISDASATKQIVRVAEKAAEKASRTEQHYGHDHPVTSK